MMTYPGDIMDTFYEELEYVITALPMSYKRIILGDFNAKVGLDPCSWNGVIG